MDGLYDRTRGGDADDVVLLVQTVHKLEIALLRLYVVNTVKTGHREKAVEFFKSFISFSVCCAACISVSLSLYFPYP